MTIDRYSAAFRADAPFRPPPIRGEIVFGPAREGKEIRILDAVILDPLVEQGRKASKVKLGEWILGDTEELPKYRRRRFTMSVPLVSEGMEPRACQAKITYQVGDRTGDYLAVLLFFPEMAPPRELSSR